MRTETESYVLKAKSAFVIDEVFDDVKDGRPGAVHRVGLCVAASKPRVTKGLKQRRTGKLQARSRNLRKESAALRH